MVGEGWGPHQTRAFCHTHLAETRVKNPMRSGFSHLRGCLGLGCCVFCAAAKWVPTADHLSCVGLVGHLLLLYWCSGRVGRGAGAITLLHQLPGRWLFGVTGSAGGLGSTQISAEPGESHGRGATSLPVVKYPAD